MNQTLLFVCCLLAATQAFIASSRADQIDDLKGKAKLIFEDDFNRAESDDSKEELGKKWKTNSQKRAQGKKQADLVDDYLKIIMAKGADHGVSVLHDAPFDDGMVKVRFRMHTAKGMKFNFNDPSAKKVAHAGHICNVEVSPKGVKINDHLTGIFEINFSKQKKAKQLTKQQQAAHLKGKFQMFKKKLEVGKWYELGILIQGDKLSAFIDGKEVGSHRSRGYDHNKQNIAFAVSSESDVDDLKIWSLEK